MGRIMRRIGTGSATQRVELGGNIEEITENYTITQPYTPPYNPLYSLKKRGNIVNFNIESIWASSISANTALVIGTIPLSLIASVNITWATMLVEPMNGNVVGYARAYINKTNGQITIKSNTSINSAISIQGNLSWLLD